ncbi:MAG TPA: TonB family protein [Pyrinomonadaceae bacterium]|nr:TonB family protein [Pyrinomonadaceae bacterium]
MFNNLIESSSHKTELRRRGSYFLFTTAIYVVLFTVAGVLSIYAYDARLEEPPIEIVMLSPLDYQPPAPAPINRNPVTMSHDDSRASAQAVRRDPMASVNVPQVAPKGVSAQPNTNPPVPDRGGYTVGNVNLDPAAQPGGPNRSSGLGGGVPGGTGKVIVDLGAPPEPPVKKTVTPRLISKGVITGEATFLPKPAYPPIAKQMRAHGPVSVQVLIDEFGKVVSATAVRGNPVLLHAAEKAALQARFKPTRLSDQPVKVSGVITYNFVLQ